MADVKVNLPFGISQSSGVNIKQVAEIMQPQRTINVNPIKDSGAVVKAKIKKNTTPVTFVLTAGAAPTIFVIGDPTGAIVAKSGLAAIVATSGTMDPAAWNRLLGTPENEFAVKAINYNTSSDTSQFAQSFLVGQFEGAGDFTTKSIDTYIAAGRRNTQFDPLLQTMDLTEDMPVLNSNAALLITVLALETVTLTLSPGVSRQ
jgi:hypothetical protein